MLKVTSFRYFDVAHSLRIEGVVEELYDVVIPPQRRGPQAIGIHSDEIRHVIRVANE